MTITFLKYISVSKIDSLYKTLKRHVFISPNLLLDSLCSLSLLSIDRPKYQYRPKPSIVDGTRFEYEISSLTSSLDFWRIVPDKANSISSNPALPLYPRSDDNHHVK
jgi:hypothetical protein